MQNILLCAACNLPLKHHLTLHNPELNTHDNDNDDHSLSLSLKKISNLTKARPMRYDDDDNEVD